MHEFSIAEALLEQVTRHAPPNARVREVEIRIGPLRGIEPEALRMAWQAVTLDTPVEGAVLQLDMLPWSISCPRCGRSWTTFEPFVDCECGNQSPTPTGGDELDLVAMSVDQEEEPEAQT